VGYVTDRCPAVDVSVLLLTGSQVMCSCSGLNTGCLTKVLLRADSPYVTRVSQFDSHCLGNMKIRTSLWKCARGSKGVWRGNR
jgi:hypothetical protein